MGYYMGDYYRGYRGDPGFFSFLGKVAKTAVGFIPGIGPVAKGAIDVASRAIERVGSSRVGPLATRVGSAIIKHPVLTAAGAAGAVSGAAAVMGRGSAAAAGMRMHAPGARGVGVGGRRRHRMNVCNPKALRRAIRRTHGFARLAMKSIHLVHPQKKARFGGFKVKRKRK